MQFCLLIKTDDIRQGSERERERRAITIRERSEQVGTGVRVQRSRGCRGKGGKACRHSPALLKDAGLSLSLSCQNCHRFCVCARVGGVCLDRLTPHTHKHITMIAN